MININQLLKELISKLETKFQENFTGLVLFGSYAKGTPKANSDIDILLTFKQLPKERYERTKLISDFLLPFEEKHQIKINPIITQESNISKSILLIEIAEYAKIIIDKNEKISKLFQSIQDDYKNGYIKKTFRENYHVLIFEDV